MGSSEAIQHDVVRAADADLHVARLGSGPPLLLLHGWPEFWWTWEPVMRILADRFTLLAPDLRGFGDSDKPAGDFGADDHAKDMLAVLDALDVAHIGVVGHDVGGAVMQAMARRAADRLDGLFFFDFAYPGIGTRMGTPDRLAEIWYQSFHLLDLAPALVGSSREACRAYIAHIIRHWAYRQAAFDDATLDRFVDTFMKPGNLAGGFAYYRAANADRIALMEGRSRAPDPIRVPTCVRWAEHDPLFPFSWTDRLGEYFSDLDLALFSGVGHFPHREDPHRSAAHIAAFFEGIVRR